MDVKITSIQRATPDTFQAFVSFFDQDEPETAVLSKVYTLPVTNDLSTLYSQIKEDRNNLEQVSQKVAGFQGVVGQSVDLTNVKSTSELVAEAAAAVAEEEELIVP